jgi:hypothetical protein
MVTRSFMWDFGTSYVPQPYGYDAEDRKILSFIQRHKVPARQGRTISHASDLLYLDSLYLVYHFVYLRTKVNFYKWELVHVTTKGECHTYVCDLCFCDEGIILHTDCRLIKAYLDVELTVSNINDRHIDDINIYDRVQRLLYSHRLIQEYQRAYIAYHQEYPR